MCLLSGTMILSMLLGSIIVANAENNSTESQFDAKYNDVKGHWAEKEIYSWIDEELVNGYENGTFKPDNAITRAEFITIVNRLFGFSNKTEIMFDDIASNDWFYNEFEKAIEAGYIYGYENGTIKPNDNISRQEAATIIFRILKLEQAHNPSDVDMYSDSDTISDWSRDAVAAIVERGYMKGYPDKTLKPLKTIKRAEAIMLLDRVTGAIYNTAGTYGTEDVVDTINSNVTIASKDITLQNLIIEGDLYLTQAIGSGDVTLKNVTVNGDTLIRGGGPNSITIENTKLGLTTIDSKTDTRIVVSGNTMIDEVFLNSGAKLAQKNLTGNGIKKAVLTSNIPEDSKVELDVDLKKIQINSQKVNVEILNSSIDEIEVGETSTETTININQKSSVKTIIANSTVNVEGKGKITKAIVNVNGVTFKQLVNNITVNKGITVVVNNKKISESTNNNTGRKTTSSSSTQSSNANLLSLTISEGTLAPSFDPNTTNYTCTVGNSIENIGITATVESSVYQSMTINDNQTVSGSVYNSNLDVGINTFNIVVTAQDSSTTKNYRIDVNRNEPLYYTALGDSITYGLSADPGKEYATLFKNHLDTLDNYAGIELANLSTIGETSTTLLSKLQSDQTVIAEVYKSDVITLGIGSNNLQRPLKEVIANAFGLDPDDPEFVTKIQQILQADPVQGEAIINGLIASFSALEGDLEAGVIQFSNDWPQIIGIIRSINPQAEIYVVNVYNVFDINNTLYAQLDPAIQAVNQLIAVTNTTFSYRIVDVHSLFNSYVGEEPILNFNLSTGLVDTHPTNKGHELILEAIKTFLEGSN